MTQQFLMIREGVEGLATQAENDWILSELYRLANDRETLLSLPRIVQVFGTRPVA